MNPEYTTELRRVAIELIEAGDPVTAGKLIVLASKMDGTYKQPRTIATTRATGCTCDRCGDHVKGLNWIGNRCLISKDINGVQIHCAGRYRLDPEPDDLPLDRMAFEEAMRAFLADDPDNDDEDTADWPDIASTYRGRSR